MPPARPDWTAAERRVLAALRTPAHVQRHLDELAYDCDDAPLSPRGVLQHGRAQCFSGALFACAALRELGHAPLIVHIDAVQDDSHCLAVYQEDGRWGAVAKSNFTTLRSRQPVYDYLALGMSYFDGYFNTLGKRSMRSFTVPLALEPFEPRGWRFDERAIDAIDRALDQQPKAWTLPVRQARRLAPAGPLLLESAMLGADHAGLWQPPRHLRKTDPPGRPSERRPK